MNSLVSEVIATSRYLAARLDEEARDEARQFERLNNVVLMTMAIAMPLLRQTQTKEGPDRSQIVKRKPQPPKCYPAKQPLRLPATVTKALDSPYQSLDFSGSQIRLLELSPTSSQDPGIIRGKFRYVELSETLPYTALSYTWGDEAASRKVKFEDGTVIPIGENLWRFLSQQQSIISEPSLFWIDAVCIDQSNVHERNHQVGLMKQIYTKASEVYIWLGKEADESDLAMDFMAKKGTRNLRPRGSGYHPLWSVQEGKALVELFERQYWRRMWIIQEIIYAQKITVCCGTKRFDWGQFEILYRNLKTMEDSTRIFHHKFAIAVLQSSASVMVWQRAHFRHPDTPLPRLQTLVKIFRDWQCTDIRDKVYALVGMAESTTAIMPDYSQSARQVFFAVQQRDDEPDEAFYSLLAQILGLNWQALDLPMQDLIEYKTHPSETLVLWHRLYGW